MSSLFLVLTSLVRIPARGSLGWDRLERVGRGGMWTHVPEIPIEDFDVAMDDLQRREFVVRR